MSFDTAEAARILEKVIFEHYGVTSMEELWELEFERQRCFLQWLQTGLMDKTCFTKF